MKGGAWCEIYRTATFTYFDST